LKGWYGNSYNHSLASRGITTKYKNIKDIELPYIKKAIFSFWKASYENNFSDFDFDGFFDNAKTNLYHQVIGQINWTPEDIVECFEEEAKGLGINVDNIDNPPCDLMFRDYRLSKLYLKIKNPPDKLLDKILLVDEIIHVEHATGSIWTTYNEETDEDDSIDIEALRKEFDQWYKPKSEIQRARLGIGEFK